MDTIAKWRVVVGLISLVLVVGVSGASANVYNYTYIGTPFTYIIGPDYPGLASDYKVTLTFTSGLLVADYGVAQNIPFTICDGSRCFSSAGDAAGSLVRIDTLDAFGLPSQWAFYLDSFTGIEIATTPSEDWSLGIGTYDPILGWMDIGQNSYAPGVWSVTPPIVSPEPSTILVLGVGLIAVWRRCYR